MSVYLYADPHFFHASPDKADGIIRMCGRPYATGREMTQALADAWRSTVSRTDSVIVVGDFAHHADPDALRKLFDSLPGEKHLVKGNHDGPLTTSLGWKSINDIACLTIEGQRTVLCHYPMVSWPGSRNGKAIQLYGHHHGRIRGNQQSADIGVDVMGPAPVRLAQIKAYMQTLPPRVDPEGGTDLENDVKP
jgi:calcineurin-like phosphoesterase family protein